MARQARPAERWQKDKFGRKMGLFLIFLPLHISAFPFTSSRPTWPE
jgi:hypothetical protein